MTTTGVKGLSSLHSEIYLQVFDAVSCHYRFTIQVSSRLKAPSRTLSLNMYNVSQIFTVTQLYAEQMLLSDN